MVLPTIRRNTFVKCDGKIDVDIVSKAFVYCELLLGVNRYPIISEKRILTALFCVYSLTLNAIVCYASINTPISNNIFIPIRVSRAFQYEFTAVLSLFIWKRFHRFYKEIENYDNKVGCRPTLSKRTMALSVLLGILSIVLANILPQYRANVLLYVPFHLIGAFENYYFGHLIDLLTMRMRLLNYYLECSTSITKTDSSPKITEFVFFDNNSQRSYFPNMCKIMELYLIIIAAHKFLMDAVKWLMLTMVVTSFVYFLVTTYCLMILVMDSSNLLETASHIGVVTLSYLPLFVPCMSSDRLREEVCRFRELLSSSLYENRLDCSNRSTTRTLLALTNNCDLSFLVLRVLNISVSLPLSFMGLIITYLLILLQFQKVLSP